MYWLGLARARPLLWTYDLKLSGKSNLITRLQDLMSRPSSTTLVDTRLSDHRVWMSRIHLGPRRDCKVWRGWFLSSWDQRKSVLSEYRRSSRQRILSLQRLLWSIPEFLPLARHLLIQGLHQDVAPVEADQPVHWPLCCPSASGGRPRPWTSASPRQYPRPGVSQPLSEAPTDSLSEDPLES